MKNLEYLLVLAVASLLLVGLLYGGIRVMEDVRDHIESIEGSSPTAREVEHGVSARTVLLPGQLGTSPANNESGPEACQLGAA